MGPPRRVVPDGGPDPVAADRAARHHSPTMSMHPRQQRKGGGTRAWLVVGIDGESRVEEVGKHAIMRRAGLLARDLRILDPMLSYPSTVLGRERAIVVKLEHIKAIITANEVLVLNSKDPLVSRFARDLQLRVSGGLSNSLAKAPENSETDVEAVETSSNHSPPLNGCSMEPPAMVTPPQFGSSVTPGVKDRNGWATNEIPKAATSRDLPFEFRALEVCLECACRCFESETSTLEQEAYPALDELTSKISTLNLEHVRQIKSRLVAISGRVQKVRDELEQLLDDDMDMAEMYLTEKLKQQQLAETSSLDEIDNDAIIPHDDRDQNSMDEAGDSNKNLSFSPNIEELGMLLEAYFVQIDGTLNKLSTLREYVDDTEDYINIMLDDEQNQLLQMGVMLSTATLITSAGIVVTGVMGMNIHIGLFDTTPNNFWETAIATVVLCILLFIAAVVWGNRGGLLS